MKKPANRTAIGIQVGVSKEAVAEARAAILDILREPGAEQETKRDALRQLSALCYVGPATITGCTIGKLEG